VKKELVNTQTVKYTDLIPMGYDFLSGEDWTRDSNGLVRYTWPRPPPPFPCIIGGIMRTKTRILGHSTAGDHNRGDKHHAQLQCRL